MKYYLIIIKGNLIFNEKQFYDLFREHNSKLNGTKQKQASKDVIFMTKPPFNENT
jgi:hypothetical protein